MSTYTSAVDNSTLYTNRFLFFFVRNFVPFGVGLTARRVFHFAR